VNKTLSNAKSALHDHLYVKPSLELIEQMKQDTTTTNSLFRRFFSEMKAQFRNKSVGRVFITGVAPI
jgi:predicted metal-dependent phosphotriesterase family hydrolase